MDPIFSGLIGALIGGLLTAGGIAVMVAGRLARVEAKVESLDDRLSDLQTQTDKRIFEIADLVKTVVRMDTEIMAELKAARLSRGGHD